MNCPHCGSENVKINLRSAGTNSKTRYYRTGVKKSWIVPSYKRSYSSQRNYSSIAVCQDCGYNWEVSSSSTGGGNSAFSTIILFIIVFAILSSTLRSCFSSEKTGEDYQSQYGGVEYVDNSQFADLTYEIVGNEYAVVTGLTKYGETQNMFSIPDNVDGVPVTIIGEKAFYKCENVEVIILPDTITEIGEEAFYECRKITHISIPPKVTVIPDSAFERCNSLDSLYVPDGVVSIGKSAFANCGFSELFLPDTLTEIGASAFSGCYNLKFVIVTENVTSIGESCFKDCRSLSNVILPEALTKIGGCAFWGCKSLESITIPRNIKEAPADLFVYCENLKEVYLPSDCKIPSGNCPFSGANMELEIIRY